MKKTLFFALIITLVQCKGQKKDNIIVQRDTITPKNKSIMYRPKIDSNIEKLDLEKFKDKLSVEKYDDANHNIKNVDWYKYNNDDNINIISLEGSDTEGFNYSSKNKNTLYSISKQYYGGNKIIKRKSIIISDPSIYMPPSLGKEYQYNEKGELMKTIDHDEGYDFSFEQAFNYVKKNFHDDELLKQGRKYTYQFDRAERNGKKYWKIKLHIGYLPPSYVETVLKLDAKTGDVLSQKEYLYEIGKPIKLQKIVVPDKTGKEESEIGIE